MSQTPIEDGQEAQRILQSKLYQAAFTFARDSIIRSFESKGDEGGELHAELKALRRVENRLEELMHTGLKALEAAKKQEGRA